MLRNSSNPRLVGVAAWLLLATSPSGVLARSAFQATTPATTVTGSELYRTYCASCHGTSGRGNGSVAIFLRRAPADLTGIAARNKGEFPAERVYGIIDGRRAVKVHGDSQMPVWGDAFSRSSTTSGDEQLVKARIDELVKYLRSIQAPAGAK
jgi:mono/diheme cytochrome c family protein